MSKPKIGVWVCECGGNIGDVVDTEKVIDSLGDDVEIKTIERYLCSKPSVDNIRKKVKEEGLDRVVLACCTPKMHHTTFLSNLEEEGLNQGFLEMVNIREQVAWVTSEKSAATEKAKSYIKAAVKRVALHEPLEKKRASGLPGPGSWLK